jgi:hypothetical protein
MVRALKGTVGRETDRLGDGNFSDRELDTF